jgi:hypothetical protein
LGSKDEMVRASLIVKYGKKNKEPFSSV